MDVGAGNAAFAAPFHGKLGVGQPKAVELFQRCFPIRHQFQQRPGKHIPGGAHAEVKIQCFH